MSPPLQPLTALPPGSTGTVAEIKLPPEFRPRLMEMGLLVGTPVQLVRFAPLGDPVEIKVRGYHLSLRRHEADNIWVRIGSQASPTDSGQRSGASAAGARPPLGGT
ncbi:MAG: ferrous iron transport protein A [Verrucomicrobiae bacterium]|nr:ferrous iron transport protein A [Verrucomicrobiae bacterium]